MSILITIMIITAAILGAGIAYCVSLLLRLRQLHGSQQQERQQLQELLQQQRQEQQQARERFDAHQLTSLSTVQTSLQKGMDDVRKQVQSSLEQQSKNLGNTIGQLTQETRHKLNEISGQVDRKLAEGFEKTHATFTDVVKRLTIIDEAQKRITELSNNVVSLQEVLSDKKTRGAFGEVQLEALIRNMIPENHFSMQHTLSNGKRVDCLLMLPEPTGNIAIDAKFPLESYQKLSQTQLTDAERKVAETTFKQDVRHHLKAIHDKYILPGETSDGAMMFLPAEAIFAEIHAHFPELVAESQRLQVWMVSPTTIMAILTTARAVVKDAATRKQIHIIQEHLVALGKDFSRFQQRMDKLSTHINQAQRDVEQVHASSRKISSRFDKIEKVELPEESFEAIEAAKPQDQLV